ncbi:LexA repressor [compost metagenome]
MQGRQQAIINFIAHFTSINGYPPSNREIQAAVNLKSVATAKGVQGEIYPCKPDIFEQTYEKV